MWSVSGPDGWALPWSFRRRVSSVRCSRSLRRQPDAAKGRSGKDAPRARAESPASTMRTPALGQALPPSGSGDTGFYPARIRFLAVAGLPASYPVIAIEPVPVQYVERSEQEAQQFDHWLYCAKAQGYFPHVGDCPEGWERVPPAPLK